MIGRTGCRLFVLLLIASAGITAEAKRPKHRSEVPWHALPAWVHEASTRPVPETDAAGVVLYDERIVTPLPDVGVRRVRRVAYKILGRAALERANSFSEYYVKDDRFEKLEAWTMRPDGTFRRADPFEDMSDLPVVGGLAFNDSRVRTIRAQGVSVGSIVAYESVIEDRFDPGAERFSFSGTRWPVVYTRFELEVPGGWKWDTTSLRADDLEYKAGERGFVYIGRNLEPPPREERRPPARELVPVAWARWWNPDGTRGFRNWNAVGLWSAGITEKILNDRGEADEIANRLKPANPQLLLDALAQAYEFAARSIRYVAIDVGLGLGAGYVPATPAEVCSNRYGDCKDKTWLLRAIAERWGVKTYPVFVATRSRGKVVPEVPTPVQFNHCIAAVQLPEGLDHDLWSTTDVEGIGTVVFLDATVRDGSPWALRSDIQGTLALLIHSDGAVLARLPVQDPAHSITYREIDLEIDSQGAVVEGRLSEKWTGTAATTIRRYYAGRSEKEYRDKILEDLQDRFPGASVSDYGIEGLDDIREPVIESTTIAGGIVGKRVGDLLIIEPGKLGYGVVRGNLAAPPRRWPLYVGLPREEQLRITIRAPSGWIFEELRPSMKVEAPHLSAEANWSSDEQAVHYERRARLLTTEVSVNEYPDFREGVLKIRNEDRQAIVLVPE